MQAIAQAERGRLGPAVAALERLVRKKGAPAEAYHFLGLLMAQDGRAEQGVYHMERACAMSPGLAKFESNLANVLAGMGRLEDAVGRYKAAAAADPAYAPARVGLAAALLQLGRLAEAEHEASAAFRSNPESSDAAANLASCLITTGRAAEAVDHLQPVIDRLGPSIKLNTLLSAAMNYDDRTTPQQQLDAHHLLGGLHAVAARTFTEDLMPMKASAPDENPLRIGFLSADFRDHPVGMFIEPVLAGLHRTGTCPEVFCYDLAANPDGVNARFRSLPVTWREVAAMDDASLVNLIRGDSIDVLVELSGHSLGHRQTALAARTAPKQVSMLGYPATTGNPAIDARIVDYQSDPARCDQWCTEQLVRLDRCAWCFTPPAEHADPAPPQRETAPDGIVRFGSFNNLAKTTPRVIETWAAILKVVPGATLTLKNGAFIDEPTRDRVRQSIADRGVDPDLVITRPPTRDAAEHLAAYRDIDIALDTFPYAGTTTTCEALWMGVPVVTLAGELHAGRVGVSLLTCIGLDELIATSPAEYVDKAAALAADRGRLESLHRELRARMSRSALCDATSFCASLHAAIASLAGGHAVEGTRSAEGGGP